MTASEPFREAVARTAHPRLVTALVVGVAIGLLGTTLALAGAGPRSIWTRLAIVGYLVALIAGSGYVAFGIFERGFD